MCSPDFRGEVQAGGCYRGAVLLYMELRTTGVKESARRGIVDEGPRAETWDI